MHTPTLIRHLFPPAGAWLLALWGAGLQAQEQSTVFATVVATKLFVVGAANPLTGLFYQPGGADTVWQHTGPANIRNFGVDVGGSAERRVLYLAAGNGLHKSSDGGRSWRVTTGWDITEVLAVSQDPHDSNTVYIATPYGVFRTTDGCRTWTRKAAGLTAPFTSWVLADRVAPGVVWCGTEDGAFRSSDRGESWARTGLTVPKVRVIAQHPRDPNVLAAGTEDNGIYMTRNGGGWWAKCEAGVDNTTFYTIAFDPSNPELMYAAGYITGVYKSTDGGRRWQHLWQGVPTLSIHSLAVDPADGNRVYAGTFWGGVMRSTDAGLTWHPAGLSGSEVWSVMFQPF